MSLAYSGSIAATGPLPMVARCQAPTNRPKIASDTTPARSVSDWLMGPSRRPPDPEAFDVILRLRRIERLAHDREALRCGRRRREACFPHQLASIGRKKDLLGNAGVVDIAFDLAPTFHLREDPHRERFPGERIEVDPIGNSFYAAKAVREYGGEYLFQHCDRLVNGVRRCDGFRDLFAVLRLAREGGGIDNRFQQCRI